MQGNICHKTLCCAIDIEAYLKETQLTAIEKKRFHQRITEQLRYLGANDAPVPTTFTHGLYTVATFPSRSYQLSPT